MLTVPFAGTSAGRSASIQTEAPQTGAAIAEFGQQLQGIGNDLEAERLDRQTGRLQLDMTRDLNGLRLRAEEIGDPDQLEVFWKENTAALKQSFLTGTGPDGRPRVDPKIAERFDLAFEDMSLRHGFALGEKALNLRQSQTVATYADYRQEAGNQAARSDPDSREDLFADHRAQLDRLAARGILTPEEVQAEDLRFRAETENSHATILSADDPRGLLATLEAGGLTSLTPEERARWTVRARAGIAAEEKGQSDAADVADRARKAADKVTIAEGLKVVRKGRAAPGAEAMAASGEAAAEFPEEIAELRGAIALRDQGEIIDKMTPDELRDLSARLKAQPADRAFQTEAADAVDKRLAEATTALAADPIDYAASVELPVPALDLADPRDIDAITTGLAGRVIFGQWMRDRGFTDKVPLVSNAERDRLRELAGIDADPADRVALARTMAIALDGAGPAAMSAIIDDPVFNHVGGLMAAGGSEALGQTILRGQEAIARKTVVMPPFAARADPFFATIGGLFDQLPTGGERAKASVMATADALFAARNSLDASGDVDPDAFAAATHEAMGGTGAFGSRDATGGIQELNGQLTFMPVGLNAGRAEAALGRLANALDNAPVLGGAPTPLFDRAEAAIAAAATTPGRPVISGSFLTADDWRDMQFIAVGDDRFILARRLGSTLVKATDNQTGEPYTLSLRRLLDAAEGLAISATRPPEIRGVGTEMVTP